MDIEDTYNSDEDIDVKKHDRLLESVAKLDKSQHVKKPTRTEPTPQVSEFNLVKSKQSVHLSDLAKSLNKKPKHVSISKKVQSIQKNIKPLPKPLEKPKAERIARTVTFKDVREKLNRWQPIVTSNRVSDHLRFPLKPHSNIKIKNTSVEFLSRFRFKSDLQKALEEVNPISEEKPDETDEFPLSLEEIVERRKEAARFRAQQSYQEAKARRQNKIKSKKFHRVQRKEKMKQQLKEFELLQKTDPEAALKKLDELDKARAHERLTLRHRSTGQWAKSKQVRAKYDKESRQVLAQQLAISRDLTQKANTADDSDSEPDETTEQAKPDSGDNPWLNTVKTSEEVHDFVSGYRKYWDEKNKNDELKKKYDQMDVPENQIDCSDDDEDLKSFKTRLDGEIKTNGTDASENISPKSKSKKKSLSENTILQNRIKKKKPVKIYNLADVKGKIDQNGKLDQSISTNSWVVTSIEKNPTKKTKHIEVDEIFDDFEYKIKGKIEKKLERIKKINDSPKKTEKTTKQKKPVSKVEANEGLSFRDKQVRPVIDEEMNETSTGTRNNTNTETKNLNKLTHAKPSESKDIDPTNFIKTTPTALNSAIPDLMSTGEEALDDLEPTDSQQMTISEAFEDDDIEAEFRKEKQEDIDKNKPKDIDLSLPGWGSWGGTNIKASKKRRRRFIVKFPEKLKRRDENKGDLIVNERKDKKVRGHQVSEVPFPFKSVSDFEASIRAPLGNDFVPQKAHKMLTRPKVITKLGGIIEPIDEDVLIDAKKKRKRA